MHKGIKPAAQPRSLRSIAETNRGKLFPPTVDVEDSDEKHVDAAEQARPTSTGKQPSGSTPFANLKDKE
jgi:hypothetical protein